MEQKPIGATLVAPTFVNTVNRGGALLIKWPMKDPQLGLSVVVPAVMDMAEGESPLFRLLDGLPVIARTLRALNQMTMVDEIILVVREGDMIPVAEIRQVLALDRVKKICICDQPGIFALATGVYECDKTAEYIAVHDPLRPFISEKTLKKLQKAAKRCNAVAPGGPVGDTIKIVADGMIQDTLDRSTLRVLQTPQIIQGSLLKAAIQRGMEAGETGADMPTILAYLGIPLPLIEGEEENISLASEADLPGAQAILRWRNRL